jgi:hypothetical protein
LRISLLQDEDPALREPDEDRQVRAVGSGVVARIGGHADETLEQVADNGGEAAVGRCYCDRYTAR